MSRKKPRRSFNSDVAVAEKEATQKSNLVLKNIMPMTKNQKNVFNSFYSGKNIFISGLAGTGKSFITVYLALKDILSGDSDYKKLVIIRSSVTYRDIGFLPGNEKMKMQVYEAPYKQICTNLFGRGDAYEILSKKGLIQFESSSFLRGTTYDNCIIIVDETQNMSFQELDTIITRVGDNTRIIFCGDINQNDLIVKRNEESGLPAFYKIISKMNFFDTITFGIDDIVRSGLVKSYLVTKHLLVT